MSVVVIGLGYVGLPIAINAAEAGYKVIAFDSNQEKILKLQQGITEIPDITLQQIKKLQSNGQISFISKSPSLSLKYSYCLELTTASPSPQI